MKAFSHNSLNCQRLVTKRYSFLFPVETDVVHVTCGGCRNGYFWLEMGTPQGAHQKIIHLEVRHDNYNYTYKYIPARTKGFLSGNLEGSIIALSCRICFVSVLSF